MPDLYKLWHGGGGKRSDELNLTYLVFLPIQNFSQPCGGGGKKTNKKNTCVLSDESSGKPENEKNK